MGRYIVVPIARDPEDAFTSGAEVIRQQFPAWRDDPADPVSLLLRSVAVLYSDVAELATRMGEEGFRYYGRGVVNLPPGDDLPAIGQVTVTAQDTSGPYVVPEGLEIVGRSPLGEPVGFRTLAEAIIPNGSTTITVNVEASEEGADANGVSGAGEFSEYVDYLTAVAFVGITGNGQDREADEAYLDRLSDELELSSPRPILPNDFAVLARRFGAFRATAIDGLNPVDDTTGNTATMAVAGVDEAGNALPSGLRTDIGVTLEAMREQGWEVFMVDPDYTTFTAEFAAVAYPGWDASVVEQAGVDALTDFFSPHRYGMREDTGQDREWINTPTVRFIDVAERLKRVEGLWYIDWLVFKPAGTGALSPDDTADVTMAGYAPLPRPGTISGTVTAS